MSFLNKIIRGDRVIWTIFILLCMVSIVEVYSASSTLTFRKDYWEPIWRHSKFVLGGVLVVFLANSVPPKHYRWLIFGLPLAWLSLIYVKLQGMSVNGADRWLSFAGISFQPSEIAKLLLIISIAFILSRRNYIAPKTGFYWIVGLSVITCGIIFIDNFSTALLLFGVSFILMFIGQIPIKLLFKLLLCLVVGGGLLFAIVYYMPENTIKKVFPRGATWKERINDFTQKDTTEDKYEITDDNYQVAHAKIAISRGGLFGKLPGNSRERDFLPQAYSDFIYAIIIEEMGLIGGLAVLFLYIMLFIRSGIIANRTELLFSKYIAMGSALILTTQALVNMAVAVDLIPVTGQPLPLISRGGTSTLINAIYIGIILSVSRFDNPKGVQREEAVAQAMEEEALAAKEKEIETII
ncbi:MAG: FtsW/RodA/SpoVE family cell cycle protein [Dysgonamonadaceae bacterium]|jgi:cell division protein FtsW|nr:FtsW/RodA/SpoVE family cell cycle protein [Dysgonamonadaceae bacterium]